MTHLRVLALSAFAAALFLAFLPHTAGATTSSQAEAACYIEADETSNF